jgi:hypothetical protein
VPKAAGLGLGLGRCHAGCLLGCRQLQTAAAQYQAAGP